MTLYIFTYTTHDDYDGRMEIEAGSHQYAWREFSRRLTERGDARSPHTVTCRPAGPSALEMERQDRAEEICHIMERSQISRFAAEREFQRRMEK